MRKWKLGLGNYLLCWVKPPPLPPHAAEPSVNRYWLIHHFLTQQKPNENTAQLTRLTYTRILLSWQGWHTWEYCSADRTDIHENTAQLTGLTYTRILLSWQGWHTWEYCSADRVDRHENTAKLTGWHTRECCSADSIDLLSICEPSYPSIFFYLPKASIYRISDPANSQKPRFVEVE